MIDYQRYRAENKVFKDRFPASSYQFVNPTSSEGVLFVAAKTNRGNIYTIRIELEQFPMSVPKVFVTKMLYDKSGNRLDSCSGSMHTLTSENNWTRICHYGPSSWTPNVSLYKVYVKCRLWLEMYEEHLVTGHPIDYYLNHQA